MVEQLIDRIEKLVRINQELQRQVNELKVDLESNKAANINAEVKFPEFKREGLQHVKLER